MSFPTTDDPLESAMFIQHAGTAAEQAQFFQENPELKKTLDEYKDSLTGNGFFADIDPKIIMIGVAVIVVVIILAVVK